jgi:hypothetical protein
MSKSYKSSFLSRTAQALGKLWAGMLSLPDDRRRTASHPMWNDIPRFPPF